MFGKSTLKICAERFEVAAGLAVGDGPLAGSDLPGERAVRHHGERFLEALKIVGTDQHSRWLAVSGYHDAVLLALDAVDQLREARLDGCEGQGLRHDHNYSHVTLVSTGP
jgi:hypothetical protein